MNMAVAGLRSAAPFAAAFLPWTEDILTQQPFQVVIEQFLNAPRNHPECYECCVVEHQNLRFVGRYLLCSTVLAGKEISEEEVYSRYHDVWWTREIVTFCRLAPCEADSRRLFIRVNNLRLSIHEYAKRQVKLEAEDHWTPRTRRMRHDGYVLGHSECIGNPLDW